jgi:phospholipid/cholesterol/gamma-HCH transport system substrate-binding protein
MNSKKGFWLGFIFMTAIVILLYGTLTVGNLNLWAEPWHLSIHFAKVGGLKKGDDVRVEGLVMGKIEKVELDEKSGVNVRCRLDRKFALYEDHKVVVEAFSILGGTYVSISRGTQGKPKDPSQIEIIEGQSPAGPMESITQAIDENRDDLRKVMLNVRDTFAQTKELVANINKGQGTLGRLATDETLYHEAKGTLEELKKTAGEAREAVTNVKEVTRKVNSGEGTLAKLINTDELHKEVVKAVENMNKNLELTAVEVRKAAEGVKTTLDRIREGQGLVGRALNDKKVADDFAETVEKLKATAANLDKITGKIARGEGTIGKAVQDDTIYEEAKKALQNLDKTFGRAARMKVYLGMESASYLESESSISRLYFRLEPDATKYFQIGASVLSFTADAEPVTFEEQITQGDDQSFIKVDLVASYKIPWFFDNHVALRVGAIEGKPGGAIDVDFVLLNHEFWASFEIRDAYGSVDKEDIDENVAGPMTRLWLRTPLWNKGPTEWWQQILYAVKAFATVSRLQDEPEFAFGIALEYSDEDIRTLLALISTAR